MIAEPVVRVAVGLRLLDVLPDAKAAPCAGDHHRPDLGIARGLERTCEITLLLAVERVELLGAVERERHHAVIDGYLDCHRGSLLSTNADSPSRASSDANSR